LVREAGGCFGPFAAGPDFLLDTPAFISAATPRLFDELKGVLPAWLDDGATAPW
jgi:hypothetical protein